MDRKVQIPAPVIKRKGSRPKGPSGTEKIKRTKPLKVYSGERRGRKDWGAPQIRESLRDEVTQLYLKGWSISKISEHQDRSRQMVQYDLRAVEKLWRESQMANINEIKQGQLGRLTLLESELWAAWERSRLNRKSSRRRIRHLPAIPTMAAGETEEGDTDFNISAGDSESDTDDFESNNTVNVSRVASDNGTQVVAERIEREHSEHVEERDGDPRFIELLLRCMQERAKITGLYPKEQADDSKKEEPVRRVVVYLPAQNNPDNANTTERSHTDEQRILQLPAPPE